MNGIWVKLIDIDDPTEPRFDRNLRGRVIKSELSW